MEKLKKTILLITGPGVLLMEVVVLFLCVFTSTNARPWIIGGLIIFFVVFIPLYGIEYFKQEFKSSYKKKLQFKKNTGRTEWKSGNVHGSVPSKSELPGKLFKK